MDATTLPTDVADRIAQFREALPPQTQADFDNLLADVFEAAQADADAAIKAEAAKVPVIGPIAASILKAAADKAVAGAQAEIESFMASVLAPAGA